MYMCTYTHTHPKHATCNKCSKYIPHICIPLNILHHTHNKCIKYLPHTFAPNKHTISNITSIRHNTCMYAQTTDTGYNVCKTYNIWKRTRHTQHTLPSSRDAAYDKLTMEVTCHPTG